MSGQRRWVPALLAAVLALMLPGGGEALPAGGAASVELPEEGGLVALTFDDGPRPATTGRLLDGLALRELPATFFWWAPAWRATRKGRLWSGAWRRRATRSGYTPLTT